MTDRLAYRPEVDGLRAFAVTAVILYHAQLIAFERPLFASGLLGVDLFFVISGYLITQLICDEFSRSHQFNYLDFYARRVRRLVPTLLVVVFASFPMALLILQPSALIEYAKSALASVTFLSNYYFYTTLSDYGAEAAQFQPLLHTWSLSVEEQFYLLYPVILIRLLKLENKIFIRFMLGLIFSSLGLYIWLGSINSSLSFFFTFSRLWELLAGGLVAIIRDELKSSLSELYSETLSALGIGVVFFVLCSNFYDSHPDLAILCTVIGTMCIICFSSPKSFTGKLLAAKPVVALGLISYSLYLVHFVVFAFGRNVTQPTNYTKLLWILITLSISIFLFHFVERPFREKRVISTRFFKIFLCAATSSVLIPVFLILASEGYPGRFDLALGLEAFEQDNKKLEEESTSIYKNRNLEHPFFLDYGNRILILGNSHAIDVFNALFQNRSYAADFDFIRDGVQIRCFNETLQESSYANARESIYNSKNYQNATGIVISTRFGHGICRAGNERQATSSDLVGLGFFLQRAKADGKKIVVMGNAAEFAKINNEWPTDYAFRLFRKQDDEREQLNVLKRETGALLFSQLKEAREKNMEVRQAALKYGAYYYDKVQLGCSYEMELCFGLTEDGHKIYYDYGHWTLEGAKFFGRRMLDDGFLELFSSINADHGTESPSTY